MIRKNDGKNQKVAATVLTALLYAQGALCLAAVTLVVLKDRSQPEPTVVVASSAGFDTARVH